MDCLNYVRQRHIFRLKSIGMSFTRLLTNINKGGMFAYFCQKITASSVNMLKKINVILFCPTLSFGSVGESHQLQVIYFLSFRTTNR